MPTIDGSIAGHGGPRDMPSVAVHDIQYDPAAGLMRLRMAGFWSLADVKRFADDLLATVGGIAEPSRNFNVLSVAVDFPVQSQEVSDALTHITNVSDQMNPSGRKAIVVGSMMNKLQAQRALARPNLGVFLSEADAMAWLATPRSDPA